MKNQQDSKIIEQHESLSPITHVLAWRRTTQSQGPILIKIRK